MMENCWKAYADNCVAAPGPIGIVAKAVAALGWGWHDFDSFPISFPHAMLVFERFLLTLENQI